MGSRSQHRLALLRFAPLFQHRSGLVQPPGAQQQAHGKFGLGRALLAQGPRLALVLGRFFRLAAIDQVLGQQLQQPGPALPVFLPVR